MNYKIVNIGAVFSNKAIKALEEQLNSMGKEGYEFHSVIQVERPAGCLGGSPKITYLAVFVRK